MVLAAAAAGMRDLYVKFGSAPTSNSYDCRPTRAATPETCTWNAPASGTWHVQLSGFGAWGEPQG